MVDPTCEKWSKWKQHGKDLKLVRMNNEGEIKSLEKRSDSAAWKLGIVFEYTARDTPQ